MKKLLLLFLFVSTGLFAQTPCLDCANANGWYCGDDESNWTQYSPEGCVPNVWINDGWIDCIDASDENGAVPTTVEYCNEFFPVPCDTIYVDVPVYIYETIFQTDTIYNTEYITQIVFDTIVEIEYETIFEEIFVTDTLWMEGALDTMFIDIIEYVDVFIFDTIVEIETEYIEFFTTDTIIEYVEIINTEYLDCDTGLPCSSNIPEIIEQSKKNNVLYNLLGQAIKEPNGIYIENGKVKHKLK